MLVIPPPRVSSPTSMKSWIRHLLLEIPITSSIMLLVVDLLQLLHQAKNIFEEIFIFSTYPEADILYVSECRRCVSVAVNLSDTVHSFLHTLHTTVAVQVEILKRPVAERCNANLRLDVRGDVK